MLRIITARKLADMLWPSFLERDGVVLPAWVATASPPPGAAETLNGYEHFQSHTHIRDLFRWDVPYHYYPLLDLERPDAESPQYSKAWELAQLIGRVWFAKFRDDFPDYRFRVYVIRLDDPMIRYHHVQEHDRVWITDEKAATWMARGDKVSFCLDPHTLRGGTWRRIDRRRTKTFLRRQDLPRARVAGRRRKPSRVFTRGVA